MTAFTRQQVEQLLRPINRNRVLRDGKGHSHVSQQDVTAHLIRMFGFGSFDTDVVSVECVFEHERKDPQTGKPTGRWDCCYRALLRLTIKDQNGNEICHFEDGSTATAQNQTRGDAHDLAYKSALSLAKKRAAINLGDQFGLSLYNRGQLEALVRGTLVMPDGEAPTDDVQEGVPQQVSLGNDEIDRDLDGDSGQQTEPGPSETEPGWAEDFKKRVNASLTDQALKDRWDELVAAFKAGKVTETLANEFKAAITERKAELERSAA